MDKLVNTLLHLYYDVVASNFSQLFYYLALSYYCFTCKRAYMFNKRYYEKILRVI